MKLKYPSFLVRVIKRFWKQSFKDYFMIIRQELRFSKMLKTCAPISVDNLYVLLHHLGIIQEQSRKNKHGDSTTSMVSADIKQLMDKYKKYIELMLAGDTVDTEYEKMDSKYDHGKAIVKNLIIYFSEQYEARKNPWLFDLNIYANGQLKNSPSLYFFDCAIVREMGKGGTYPQTSISWMFEKYESSKISFSNCIFSGIDVSIRQRTDPNTIIINERVISFKNTFSISNDSGFWANTIVDSRLCQLDGPYQDGLLDVSFTNVLIQNCQFYNVDISGLSISLKGKNIIKGFHYFSPSRKFIYEKDFAVKVELSELEEANSSHKHNFYLGTYQTISPYGQDWVRYKSWLLELKAIAEGKGDYSQRDILNREILKCNSELIRLEPWLASWQDRLTLWFNATFSNYGISWVRPLALLTGVNILYSLLVVYLSSNDLYSWEFLHTFLESFNPLYTPELSDEDKKGGMYALLLGAGLLHKLFFAICVYEIIRAARRFSRQ